MELVKSLALAHMYHVEVVWPSGQGAGLVT